MKQATAVLLILATVGCSSLPRAVKYPAPHWLKPAFDQLAPGLPAPDFTL